MRPAQPNELQTHAYPVIAAAVSEEELLKWFPVTFHEITDPQEAAEPSKAAVIKLDAGEYFVLYYGKLSNQLTLRIPTSVNASSFLASLFHEAPIPRSRIIWRRQDAQLPKNIAAKTVALSSSGSRSNKGTAPRDSKRSKPE